MAAGRGGGRGQEEAAAAAAALPQSVGLLSIAAGSLVQATHLYGATGPSPPLPRSAVGLLQLALVPLLAYAGAGKSLRNASLPVALCLTVSLLWGGCGAIQILAGQGLLWGAADLRDAAVPGLAALGLGLLLIGLVGFLQREAPLGVVASAVALACAHEIAASYDAAFGSAAAVACSHLVACLVAGYVGLGRCLFFLSRETVALPGTGLAKRKAGQRPASGTGTSELASVGLILNMLSASVFGCKLLGVTSELFVGQVPWLWAGGICQLGISVFSFRTGDPLAATSFAFTSLVKFAGGYSLLLLLWLPEEPRLPMPPLVALATLFATLALFIAIDSLADALYLLSYVAFCIALACCPRGFWESGPQAVAVAIFVASALLTLFHLYNGNAAVKIPGGERRLRNLLSRLRVCKLREGKELRAPYLGYSKCADAAALGYAGSVLASSAIAVVVEPQSPLATVALPWVLFAGGVLKLLCGSLAFSRGKTLESCAFVLYGFAWIIWGLARYGGLYGTARGSRVAVCLAPFVLFNACIVLCALVLSASWFVYSLAFELVLLGFLLDAVGSLPAGYSVAASILFGLVSFYCFLSALVNSTFERPQLPVGCPIVRLRGFGGGSPKCPHLPARKASAVKQVAEIMKKGGACGIPTDTVYVLAAACSRPDAVEKVYNTKRHAQDRPMSLWISSLKQLEAAKNLFSPVLWDFMAAAWPSPISLVVPRGEWVECLGMKDSAKYVGTPQSVAIRTPDCSITTHLIDMVGPITVTSANPTGEADTTHHHQVYAKLGDKESGWGMDGRALALRADRVDAVLCDGPSPENIASTVVDCTKIESGAIGFFRVGVVPKSQVLQILERAQRRHQAGDASSTRAAAGKAEQQTLPGAVPSGTRGLLLEGDSPAPDTSKAVRPEEATAAP